MRLSTRRLIMKNIFLKSISLLLVFFCAASTPAQRSSRSKSNARNQTGQVIERGTFNFYETKQVKGQETYEIRNNRGRLEVTAKIDLPFMGAEEKPSLTAKLVTRSDLSPESFEIKGIRPLGVSIDRTITIDERKA